MNIKFEISKDEYNDLTAYCNLNNLDINLIVKKSFQEGYRIEKYGLLNAKDRIIEKEIIKHIEVPVEIIKEIEVPIEIIKEIPVVKYVEIEKPIEKIVEIIKEVPSPPEKIEVIKYVDREVVKEVIVEKPIPMTDDLERNLYLEKLENKLRMLESQPPIIKEVIIEKEVPIEIIKEVIIEKEIPVEKVDDSIKTKFEALQQTIMKLKQENIEKEKLLTEMRNNMNLKNSSSDDKLAVYLTGSNLINKPLK